MCSSRFFRCLATGLAFSVASAASLSASVLTFRATGVIQELGDNVTPNALLTGIFAIGDAYTFDFTYEADPLLNPAFDEVADYNIYHISSIKLTVQSTHQGQVVAGAYGDSTISVTDTGGGYMFRASTVNTDGFVGAHTFYTNPVNPYTTAFWLLMDLQGFPSWSNLNPPTDFGTLNQWSNREVVFFLGDVSSPHRISMSVDTLSAIPEPAHYATGLSAAVLLGALVVRRRRTAHS